MVWPSRAAEIEVTYLANAGFAVTSLRGQARAATILIDALFGEGLRGYPKVAAEERRRLESASPPYDRVAAVLVTHAHGDHFDPASVARFLLASPSTHFVSTPQAVSRLRRALGEADDHRLHALLPPEGESLGLEIGDWSIEVFQLHHGRGRAQQNLGFLIETDEVGLLHVGDTEVVSSDVAPLGFERHRIDVALLPVWYFTYAHWSEVVRRHWRARLLVGMHLAEPNAPASFFGNEGSYDERVRRIREDFPGVRLMRRAGERLRVGAQ